MHLTICNQKVFIQISRFALPIIFFILGVAVVVGTKSLMKKN